VNGTHLIFSAGLGINIGGCFRIQFTHVSNAHSDDKGQEFCRFSAAVLSLYRLGFVLSYFFLSALLI